MIGNLFLDIFLALLVYFPFLLAIVFLFLSYQVLGKDEQKQWDLIVSDLKNRYEGISHILKGGAIYDQNSLANNKTFFSDTVNPKMVLIDLLVEKAQRNLTVRSRSYFCFGVLMFYESIGLALFFSIFLFYNMEVSALLRAHVFEVVTANVDVTSNWQVFTLELIKRITAGGAILGVIYLLAATSNSCFRESTILLHRRHLLRYIRLMSYEKEGAIDPKDLRDIFGVDQAATTGFDKVKVESIRDNLIGKLIEAVGNIYKNNQVNIGEKSDPPNVKSE